MMQVVNKDNFVEDVTKFNGMVVVDFGSGSCGKCNMLKSHIEQLSDEYTDDMSIKFVEMNIDDNIELAMSLGIRSIPAIKIFKNGEEVWSKAGLFSTSVLKDAINQHKN